MTLEVVAFSYTGNGVDDRVLDLAALSGQAFTWTPQFAIIKNETTTAQAILTIQFDGGGREISDSEHDLKAIVRDVLAEGGYFGLVNS